MTTRRSAAVASAVVAVGAATLMGLTAGTASASGPGECTDNVNVRAQPSLDAQIVALCEAGTPVQTGRVRNGFVEITDLGGWAAEEYIAVDNPRSTPSTTDATPSGSTSDDGLAESDSSTENGQRSPRTTGPTADDASSGPSGNSFDGQVESDRTPAPQTQEVDEPAGLFGGLL